MHLTLGILRTSQAVFHALSFSWLDGFAVPAPAQVTQTVGWLRAKQTQGNINIMRINKNKLFAGVLVGLIAVLIIGILYYRVTAIIKDVFAGPALPSAILQTQGIEQTGEIGSYWWHSGGTDLFGGIETPREALLVSSPFNATLKLFKDTSPSGVKLHIIIAEKMRKVPYEKGIYWDDGEVNATLLEKSLLPQKEQTINLELKSGLYIILISASWEQLEGVDYGFLVDVK